MTGKVFAWRPALPSRRSFVRMFSGVFAARRRETEGFFSRKIPTPAKYAAKDRRIVYRKLDGSPQGVMILE